LLQAQNQHRKKKRYREGFKKRKKRGPTEMKVLVLDKVMFFLGKERKRPGGGGEPLQEKSVVEKLSIKM